MKRYEEKLFRYIKRISSVDDATAEDILQECFIKAYENLNDFDQSLKFSSWIYRIAHNQTISHFRKYKNQNTISLDDSEVLFEVLAADLDVKKQVAQKMEAEKIRELMGQLDPKYREVLVLKFLEDKDYTEISNILRKPMGSIATLINRAKTNFKKILEKIS